jgi:hypothetical protein
MADSKLTGLTELSAPALGDWLYQVDISDTTDDAAGSSRKLTNERLAGFFNPSICNGRLTTETGVPISTSDRTAQSTLYFTPFNGNRIALYDGTRWKLYTFTERSLALSGLTSGKNYDVFIYDNAGTLTLELSAAWTDDTTRADALALEDGIYVKSGAATRRYLGTIRTTDTDATEDSAAKRFVWNLYNQVPLRLEKNDTTSWSYSTATIRQFNGDATHQVEFVQGGTSLVFLTLKVGTSANNADRINGIGLDSTTDMGNTGTPYYDATENGTSNISTVSEFGDYVSAGYHSLKFLERGNGFSGHTHIQHRALGALKG